LEKLKYSCGYSEKGITMTGTGQTKTGMLLALALGMLITTSVLAAPPEKAAICSGCHGEDGNSASPAFPKLAGQSKVYLAKQLGNMKSGKRNNPMMVPDIVSQLNQADIEPLVEYFSSQKLKPNSDRELDKKLAAQGQKIFQEGIESSDVPVCAGCHQANAEGSGAYPRLAGQHADYIVKQLQDFSTGERHNDVSRFMRVIAKRLTEQDMKAVAEYLSGL